jgi:general L-amino acid transport system permease protein
LFWYVGVIAALPGIQEATELGNLGYLTNRGIHLTWIFVTETGRIWLAWLLTGFVLGIVASWLRRRHLERNGLTGSAALPGVLVFLALAVIGYFAANMTASMPEATAYELRRGDRGTLFEDVNRNGVYEPGVDRTLAYVPIKLFDREGQVIATGLTEGDGTFRFINLPAEAVRLEWETPAPLAVSEPQLQGFNFRGGLSLTPEFAALLIALVVYTGAFIAEIVRAGISAVNKGQWEASRALGLNTGQTLRLIVLPQALRVIIPPLTSQYLNLVKNSSLAIAVGYPDLFNVSRTIVNQTGAEVQVILMVMGTYLSFSLITSLFMNWYNKRIALVER